MSDSSHHANDLVKNTARKGNASNDRIGKLMMLIKVLVLAASLTVAVGYLSNRSRAQQNDDRSRGQNEKEYDQQISDNAQRMMEQGKQIFRYDTFGSEDFWGGKLRLHEAIAGQKLGGVGNGVSPKTALALGLKVDAEALPADLVAQIKAWQGRSRRSSHNGCTAETKRCRRCDRFFQLTTGNSGPSASNARCVIPPLTTHSRPALANDSTAGEIAI